MLKKVLLTLAVATFGLMVPVLEISETHLFNPLWPPHARLHEGWQLVTNSAIAAVCLWLAWRKGDVRGAALLALVVVAGFLAAFGLRATYGGSMLHTDGSEIAIGGVNVAVLVMVLAGAILAILAASSDRRQTDL